MDAQFSTFILDQHLLESHFIVANMMLFILIILSLLFFLHQIVEQVVSLFERRNIGRGLLAFAPVDRRLPGRLATATVRSRSTASQEVRRVVPEATGVSTGGVQMQPGTQLNLVSRLNSRVVSLHGRCIVDECHHHGRASDEVIIILGLGHGAGESCRQAGGLMALGRLW